MAELEEELKVRTRSVRVMSLATDTLHAAA